VDAKKRVLDNTSVVLLLHFGVLRKQRNQTDAHHYNKRRNKCQEKLQLLPELVDVQQRPEQLVPQ
jgi:hypothetical protein